MYSRHIKFSHQNKMKMHGTNLFSCRLYRGAQLILIYKQSSQKCCDWNYFNNTAYVRFYRDTCVNLSYTCKYTNCRRGYHWITNLFKITWWINKLRTPVYTRKALKIIWPRCCNSIITMKLRVWRKYQGDYDDIS